MNDESMMEPEDSMLSYPGPANPRNSFQTPAHPVRLGMHPQPHHPQENESFEGDWAEGASPASEDCHEGEDREAGGGDEGEDEGSDSSSAMFDREADPEGWARRLDELAGVLEVGEEEARAIRWGPTIGKERQRDGPDLPMEDFGALIDHHLDMTEWRYTSPCKLLPQVPGRATAPASFFGDGWPGGAGEVHPIRVMGTSWIGRDVGELERRMGGLGAETNSANQAEALGMEDLDGGMMAGGR